MADNKIIVPEKKIITNATLADRAVAFISALKHTKGEWHGKNFELLPWQEKVVRDVFGTVKENGYRQYNTAYIEIPKKQGKSELAAAVALYLLAGDGEWARRSTAAQQTGSRHPSSLTSPARWWSNALR